ncbi:MAG: transposase [Gammaproteobacteria bacterium]
MDTIDQNNDSKIPAKPIQKRRHYRKALKRQMVEETLTGQDSVSVVARRYDINANQLFKWRQQYRMGLLSDEPDPWSLIPIAVAPSPASRPLPEDAEKVVRDAGRLEITLAGGHRLVVTGTVCPEALQTVLTVLSAC